MRWSLQMVYQWTEELSIRTNCTNRKASLTNGDFLPMVPLVMVSWRLVSVCVLDMCGSLQTSYTASLKPRPNEIATCSSFSFFFSWPSPFLFLGPFTVATFCVVYVFINPLVYRKIFTDEYYPRGGAVISWLVRSTPERAVRFWALAGDIVLHRGV